jgi:hypothetical protein
LSVTPEVALAVQLKLIRLAEAAVALRLEGAPGSGAPIVSVKALEVPVF